MVALAVVLISLLAGAGGCGQPSAEPVREPPAHHGPQGFRNPHLADSGRTWDFFRWRLGLGSKETPALPPGEAPPYRARVVAPDLHHLHNPDPRGIQLTWVGQDTFLIQVAGFNILTDPMFSDRASPVSFLGPKRLAPPGIPFESLPPIHAVVISHNHYDHLDVPTIRRLGNQPRYYVPLGLGAWFRETGSDRVMERDWWEEAACGPVRLICVPAQHFSMRTPWDRNRSLWCGWVLETPAGKIYFAGCSGYGPDFKEIGRRCGPMRVSLIPIGAYLPRWFMQRMHVNPPEAVQAHLDVRSRNSVGMHWGTFHLTDEPLGEPPIYLKQALQQAGLSPEEFVVMGFGETRVFK